MKSKNAYSIAKPTLIITYSDIFGQNKSDTIEELMKKLTRDSVINFCSFINSKFYSSNYLEWEFDLVNRLIMGLEKSDSEFLIKKFNEFSKNNKTNPRVFLAINSLKIIQFALEYLDNNPKEIYSNADLPILKCFLLMNEQITKDKGKTLEKSNEYSYKEKYLRTLIPSFLEDYEFMDLKDVIVQTIKFKIFFEYIQNHENYNTLIQPLLDTYSVSDWKQYLKNIFYIYTLFFKNENKFYKDQKLFRVQLKNMSKIFEIFINKFLINRHISEFRFLDEFKRKDYYLLRKYPLYLDETNHYTIMNINFLADHIFQSVYFDVKDIIEKEFGEKYSKDFKSKYSFEFSQNKLFKKTIDYFFNDKNSIKKFSEIQEKEEYSDFYLRNKNIIYLFEFKDYLMSNKVKYSLDYNKFDDFLKKRFVDEAGMSQLIKVIKKLVKGGFDFDNLNNLEYYKSNKIKIQPIIVYTDSTFTFDGFNYFLNSWFSKKILDINSKLNIRSLITIHLDFFIKFQDLFNNKKLDFENVLQGYIHMIDEIKKKSPADAKVNPYEFTTFEEYFRKKLIEKNIKCDLPIYFREISKTIFQK